MSVKRAFFFAAVSLALFVSTASGQRNARVVRQAPPPREPQLPPARQRLLLEINRQFMIKARNQLALPPQQFPRFQRIVSGHALIRSELEGEEHRTQFALREQLRLGAGGNQDSMSRLVTGLHAIRAHIDATYADESRDLEPVLNPTQRAQWQIMRDRFAQQVRAAAAQRPAGGPDPEP